LRKRCERLEREKKAKEGEGVLERVSLVLSDDRGREILKEGCFHISLILSYCELLLRERERVQRSTEMGYMGTTKLVTLSIGVVWTAMMLGFVSPIAYMSLSDWLPKAYVALAGWLTPPYLYLIINGIILSIAASSRLSPLKSVPLKDSTPVPVSSPGQDPVQVPVPVPVSAPLPDPIPVHEPIPVPDFTQVQVPAPSQEQKPIFEIPDMEEEEFVIRGPRWDMEQRKDEEVVPEVYNISFVEPMGRADSMDMSSEYTKLTESVEKPPISSRFSRKNVRPSPEGNFDIFKCLCIIQTCYDVYKVTLHIGYYIT
jgi:Domain of unknown function (DUF4408)